MKVNKAAIAGAGFGLLAAVIFLYIYLLGAWPLNMIGIHGPLIMIVGILCFPAFLVANVLSMLWFSLGMGPHGDAGFGVELIAIVVSIIIQWVVIGMIVGLFIGRRKKKA